MQQAHRLDRLESVGTLRMTSSLTIEKLGVRAEFVRGGVDNSKDTEVKAWVRLLADIRPAVIRLSTPKRAQGKVKPITKTRMKEIAELVTEKTGIQVEVAAS